MLVDAWTSLPDSVVSASRQSMVASLSSELTVPENQGVTIEGVAC